jgi:hypothetical protein
MCPIKIKIFPVFLNISRRDAKNLEDTFFQDRLQVSNKLCKSTFFKFDAYLRDQTLNLAPEPYDLSNTGKDLTHPEVFFQLSNY